MKLQNIALALGLASLGVLQQVTAARADLSWNFSLASPTDNVSGILTTTGTSYTANSPYTITGITGTVNGATISGLDNSIFDYTSEGGSSFPASQLIEWNGSNGLLSTLDGLGFDGGGLRYNAYSGTSISSFAFQALDSVAAFNGGTLTRDNNPGSASFNGISSTLTPVPEPSQPGLLTLGLPLFIGLGILKKRSIRSDS